MLEPLEDRCLLSNTTYVQSLYQVVLEREAEPAGLQGWVALLDSGSDRVSVARGIWNSTEHQAHQVTLFYQKYLLRSATSQEIQGWVQPLVSGTLTEEQVIARFHSSSEYRSLYPTDTTFVDTLYLDVLSREPDDAGKAAWLSDLAQATSPEKVALGFVSSPENGTIAARSFIRQFLSRPTSAAEVDAWFNRFLTQSFSIADTAVTVLTSAEFQQGPNLRLRKNARDLTAQEKADFVAAVHALKQTPSPFDPSLSYYDQFVQWHLTANECSRPDLTPHLGHSVDPHVYPGHMGPGFGPWHRQLLLLFEDGLRAVSGKNLTIPYWAWDDPASTAAVFADDLMGPNGNSAQGYAVTSGPFRQGNWTFTVLGPPSNDPGQFTYLVRAMGTHPAAPTMPTAEQIADSLTRANYEVAPWDISSNFLESFHQTLEGFQDFPRTVCQDGLINAVFGPASQMQMHNRVHLYVGGQITLSDGTSAVGAMVTYASPNDPLFFLHHNNVDRLWAKWESIHGNVYQPVHGGPHGMNLNDLMRPFNTPLLRTTPFSMLDTQALGYRYV